MQNSDIKKPKTDSSDEDSDQEEDKTQNQIDSEKSESEMGKQSKSISKSKEKEMNLVVINQKLNFGELLQDDIINSFCDKLQSVCPKKIDGFLAIQFLMCDPQSVKNHISGKNEAIQVLYDQKRGHYVLTHFDPAQNAINIYDSLQVWDSSDDSAMFPPELCMDVINLYSHIFKGQIPLLFNKQYEQQHDSFSCGYRCIGAILDIARGRSPPGKIYSRSAILKFVQQILRDPKPSWNDFVKADIHRETRELSKDSCITMFIDILNHSSRSQPNTPPPSRNTTSRSVSRSSSRGSSGSSGSVDENNNKMPYRRRYQSGADRFYDGDDDEDESYYSSRRSCSSSSESSSSYYPAKSEQSYNLKEYGIQFRYFDSSEEEVRIEHEDAEDVHQNSEILRRLELYGRPFGEAVRSTTASGITAIKNMFHQRLRKTSENTDCRGGGSALE